MIAFRPVFSKPDFERVLVLVAGAILAVRTRTVAAVLRVMGLAQSRRFGAYHRVLSRARWSPREAARRPLLALVERFAPDGPLVFGLDDTIERRRGAKIKAKGIYRDPVRSSKGHFVKASGLRWLSVMYLAQVPWAQVPWAQVPWAQVPWAQVPWAQRVWALPFLTVLCPSERYYAERRLRHKKLTDWARQSLLQLRRWLPGRRLVVVCDSSFSALELLTAVGKHLTVVTRLRLDAALFAPAPERRPGQIGRPRKKGERLSKLHQVLTDRATEWRRFAVSPWYGRGTYEVEVATGTAVWYHSGMPTVPLRWVLVRDPAGTLSPKAFLCTDLEADPLDILRWFVRRWTVEVTFEEARRHLGLETQRQWSDLAILRTTPCLLGLFSLVALMADRLHADGRLPVAASAWHKKNLPTFSDALAGVRMVLWWHMGFSMSHARTDTLKIPRQLLERLTRTLAYAA